jgi:hypothetical protein
VSRCRFGAKIIFPTKPTSTHTYWKKTIRVSRCRFGGIYISPTNFTSTCFYSDFHAKRVDVHLAGKNYTEVPSQRTKQLSNLPSLSSLALLLHPSSLSLLPLPITSACTIIGSPNTPLHCCVPTLPVDLGIFIVFVYQ